MKKTEIEWSFDHLGKKFIDLSALKHISNKGFICNNYYLYLKKYYDKKDFRNNLLPLEIFEALTHKYPKKKNCWCLSGLFFIDCHFKKENKIALKKNEIYQIQKKTLSKGKCLHKSISSCSSDNTIDSHSISESISLQHICHEKKVYGTRFGFEGKSTFEKMPISQASTFAGFCNKHDTYLFKSFEQSNFQKTKKQLFDLCYRALCIEHYNTKGMSEFFRKLKPLIDNSRTLIQQIEKQSEINSYIKFYDKGLNNSNFYKLMLEKSYLLKHHEDSLQHYILELEDNYPKFLSCSCINLEYDLNGKRIQDLNNTEELPKNIFVNCLTFNNKGYFILSWFSENQNYGVDIINSIINEKHLIEDKLFSLCFLYIHNTYVNPIWYENLSSSEKEDLDRLQQFWNDQDTFSMDLIKPNLDSIKVKNHYFLDNNI